MEGGVLRSLVVPSIDSNSEESDKEYLLVFIPLRIDRNISNDDYTTQTFDSWDERGDMRKTLELLGKLVGILRGIARNRNMLYYAEAAMATIGHETRSPVQWLISKMGQLCQQFRELVSEWPEEKPVSIHIPTVSSSGKVYSDRIDSKLDILRWVDEIDKSRDRYTRLISRTISDAILWARSDGAIVNVNMETIDLYEVIRVCIEELNDELRRKNKSHRGNPLSIRISSSVKKMKSLVADPGLMHHMFINLLDNAIKYSHQIGRNPWEISISAERQKNFVEISITNWGLGIDMADYENIFSSFYRSASRDRLHTIRGVGLGLGTCRRVAQLHKGSISVRSLPTLSDPPRIKAMEGYETTFTVRIPTDLQLGPAVKHSIA
jgi:signal transduction histidine kinase